MNIVFSTLNGSKSALVVVTKSRNDFPNLARLHDADQPQKYLRFVTCALIINGKILDVWNLSYFGQRPGLLQNTVTLPPYLEIELTKTSLKIIKNLVKIFSTS